MEAQSNSILLHEGMYFSFTEPDINSFTIIDIAYALSNICRFTGHCNEFYSVAQHSVLVSYYVPQKHAMMGLLHDAAEAFIGDVAKPLKELLPDYKRIEKAVESIVFQKFGIGPEIPVSVKYADMLLLRTEQRDLMNANSEKWHCTLGIAPLEEKIEPLNPYLARKQFLDRYYELERIEDASKH